MANITTSGVLPAPVQQSFNMKLLAVPTPNLIHNIPANKERMPRNGGNKMRFRRYNPLATALVPLGNSGTTPDAQLLTSLDIDAEIGWYGTFIYVNEQVVLANQEQVLNEAAIRLGVSLRQTQDELTRNMLASTASVINATNGVNGDNPTEITQADVDVITQTLLGNDAAMFMSGIEGEDKYGTSPVRNSYFALCSTALTSNLSNIPKFIYQTDYPNQQRVLPSEWGAVGNLRFLVSSIGSTASTLSALGATMYNVFCVAKEAYATIEQDGANAQFIYLPAQYSGPLAQNVSIGYKFAEVPQILNNAWVLNLRCTLA